MTPAFDNGIDFMDAMYAVIEGYPQIREYDGLIHTEFEDVVLVTRSWEEAKRIIAEVIREHCSD